MATLPTLEGGSTFTRNRHGSDKLGGQSRSLTPSARRTLVGRVRSAFRSIPKNRSFTRSSVVETGFRGVLDAHGKNRVQNQKLGGETAFLMRWGLVRKVGAILVLSTCPPARYISGGFVGGSKRYFPCTGLLHLVWNPADPLSIYQFNGPGRGASSCCRMRIPCGPSSGRRREAHSSPEPFGSVPD